MTVGACTKEPEAGDTPVTVAGDKTSFANMDCRPTKLQWLFGVLFMAITLFS